MTDPAITQKSPVEVDVENRIKYLLDGLYPNRFPGLREKVAAVNRFGALKIESTNINGAVKAHLRGYLHDLPIGGHLFRSWIVENTLEDSMWGVDQVCDALIQLHAEALQSEEIPPVKVAGVLTGRLRRQSRPLQERNRAAEIWLNRKYKGKDDE